MRIGAVERLSGYPLVPSLFVWALVSVSGLVPPFSRDALNDHLVLPLLWENFGFGWRSMELSFTAYPPLADIPYILFAGHSWDWAASLWHALAALIVLLLLDRAMRHLSLPDDVRMWSALAWVCTPVVVALCTWSYVDLWLCVVAAAMAERLLRPEWRTVDTWWFGLYLGLGLLIKYNGLPLAIAGMLALIWRWRSQPSLVWSYGWRVGLAGILVGAWWYVGNLILFGHPLYPVGEGGAGAWLQYRQLVYGESAWWAALAPLRAFFWGEANNARLFDGMLHPFYLLGLAGVWLHRRSDRIAALGLFGLVYVLISFSTGVRARYLLPGVLVWLPLFGLVWAHVGRRLRPLLLVAGFGPALIASGMYLHNLAPWTYWLQGRDVFLQQHLPDYSIQHWVSEHLESDASIYLLWMGGRAYYLERNYSVDFGTEGKRLRESIQTGKMFPYEYLLMRRNLAERTIGSDIGSAWQDFFASSCLIRRDGGYELWRMKACE